MTPHRTPRLRGDDGAVLVEFALFAPLLAVMAMGVLEFGFAYRTTLETTSAVRSSARNAVNTSAYGGDGVFADFNALNGLKAALGSEFAAGNVDRVVIYRATGGGSGTSNSVEGAVPPICLTTAVAASGTWAGTGGVTDVCNIYSGDWLRDTFANTSSVQTTYFDADGNPATENCSFGVDRHWCPESDRIPNQATADWVGVYVAIDHPMITGMFPFELTISDSAVYRIEPKAGG